MVGAPKVQTLAVRLWSYLGGDVLVLPTAAVVTFILLDPDARHLPARPKAEKDDVMAAGLGKL